MPDNIVNEKGEVDLNNWDDGADDGVDDEADGEEDEDEDEDSMDDEKMMELDDQLSQIFKRRKDALSNISTGNQRKIEAKESREDVIAFKQRVIDMLEIYVKFVEKQSLKEEKYSKISSCLLLLEPMIKCIQQTTDKSLANRIAKLLRTKVFKLKTSAFCGFCDQDKLMEMLRTTHDKIQTIKPGQHQAIYYSVCSTASLFLTKIIIENSDSKDAAVHDIIDLYAETMKQWASNGKFGPNIFIDFSNWLSSRK